ncbi:MAG: MFS transporter [Candidatus Koribacter versatilis]|uniref:MFS transporter n=1 Tax=Candidatus Korobacter versatilis TaxID=658062 RepID=A0A932EQG9_9BACT|nr:MFS transporter [Candidatus Koribacter versatilis]
MPSPRERRNVYLFGATSFLNDTASEMAYWTLPAFLASIGAGPAHLGVIEGIAESVAAAAKLFTGYVTDRVSRRKPIVVFGYALANVVKPILAIATSWWQVLIIRFADRTAKGIRGAPRDVMVAESVDAANRGSAFGLLQAMDSAGAVAGPLLALFILTRLQYGIRAVFWAAAVPGALAILVVWLFVREPAEREGKSKAVPFTLRPGLPWRFHYVLLAVALFSLGNSSDMFLVLRAADAGIAVHYAPLLGLVFNVTYTLTSWPAGRLSDKVPRHFVAASGYAVFAAVYAVFAAAPSRAAIWGAMASYGLFYSLTNPVLRALVVDYAPEPKRGRALGFFYFVTSITTLAASLITGELWQQFGARVPFLLSAALAVVAALMLLFTAKPATRAASELTADVQPGS